MRKRRRVAAVVLLGVADLGLLAAGVTGVRVHHPPSVTAEQLIARSTAYLRRLGSAHVKGSLTIDDTTEGADASTTQQSADGDVRFPDRLHVRVEDADFGTVSDVIQVAGATWTREADSAATLKSRKYALVPATPAAQADPATVAAPYALLTLLRAARVPRIVSRVEEVAIVGARIDPRAAFGKVADDVRSANVELATSDAGHVTHVLVTVHMTRANVRREYQLSKLGEKVEIAPPPPSEIDATPGIDEEDVAGFHETPLLQPAVIPQGWRLVVASVLQPDDTAEGCRQVELDFAASPKSPTGHVDMFEIPASCKGFSPPDPGTQPYRVGPYSGFASRDSDGTLEAQFRVGATVVQVLTDLDADSAARVLGELVPLDFAKPPAQIDGLRVQPARPSTPVVPA